VNAAIAQGNQLNSFCPQKEWTEGGREDVPIKRSQVASSPVTIPKLLRAETTKTTFTPQLQL